MEIIKEINRLTTEYTFDNCQFEKINLEEAPLIDKYFTSSVFIDCDLSSCAITESCFRDCKFINCNLSLSTYRNTTLHNITFTGCKLLGIDWTAITWTRQFSKRKRETFPIKFIDSALNYSIFIGLDLYAASFKDSILKGVSFEDASLECADLNNTDLTEALFLNTVLCKADLSTARNYNIDASINSIRGAKFSFPEAMDLVHSLGVEIV